MNKSQVNQLLADVMNTDTISPLLEQQRRLVESNERIAAAQERIATAIEAIAGCVGDGRSGPYFYILQK